MAKRTWSPGPRSDVGTGERSDQLAAEKYYRGLLYLSVLLVSLVAIVPLVVMTAVNYHQYQAAFHAESIQPIARFATIAQVSLDDFLAERVSALSLISETESPADMQDPQKFSALLAKMKRNFGGFVDLGLIDVDGQQISYAGPYDLLGKNYQGQDWFHEAGLRGVFISNVFLGYRNLPHFIIAVSFETNTATRYVLRATIDTDNIVRQLAALAMQPSDDAFLINHAGILQSPSRFYGHALEPCPLPVPPMSSRAEVLETRDERGSPLIIGYAFIEHSPFVLMILRRPGSIRGWLSLRRNLLLFLAISITLILVVVIGGSKYMVNRTRQADYRRAAAYHEMEYTQKLAAIGRLAAGVAHEINNPLAIIGQKAGLHKDLLALSDAPPPRERMISLLDGVLESVERCGAITQRLLGFAKHMDAQREPINLEVLLKEVLSFLEREAGYRVLHLVFHVDEGVPTIESDRGQLQQVFLNIVNNAFAAVEDGGTIEISITHSDPGRVAVTVSDDGVGIAEDDLEHIFEPFFTTKKGSGTGLGLSITYGIVQKLGGEISVTSGPGEGTSFTVTLPIRLEHP